jgi:hypothetical protein
MDYIQVLRLDTDTELPPKLQTIYHQSSVPANKKDEAAAAAAVAKCVVAC